MKKDLKFKVEIRTKIIQEKKYDYKTNKYAIINKKHYYNLYKGCGEVEISRNENSSIIEFPVIKGIPLSKLIKNVIDKLDPEEWNIVVDRIIEEWESKDKTTRINFNRQEWQNILSDLWFVKKYNYDTMFDISYGFKGIGYMGGTGVGTNVHNLTLDIVTGIKVTKEPFKTLGAIWIANRIGELLDIRKDTVHLREQIAESDVFCVLKAHPDCQETVKYNTALGYPVKSFKTNDITCLNCNPNATKKKYVSKISTDRKIFKELCAKFEDDVQKYTDETRGWCGNVKGSSKELMAQTEEGKKDYKKSVKVMILSVKQAKVIVKEETARKYIGEFDLTKEYDKALNFIKERHEKIMGVKI
jgi:hypothetical protein